MRIENRFVVVHPIHGILLDMAPGVRIAPGIAIAEPVWSHVPCGYGSALTFGNREQAVERAGALPDGFWLHSVVADIQIDGLLFASLRECFLAGLDPWYVGEEFYVALPQILAHRTRMEAGIARRTIGFVPEWVWTGYFRRHTGSTKAPVATSSSHH